MARVRRRLKKKIIVGLIILLILVCGGGVGYYFYLEHQEELKIIAEKALLKEIKSHYGDVVEVNKETILYEEKDGKYESVGTIGKGEVVSLEECEIDTKTKYFKIKELGYYVKYQDLKVGGEIKSRSDRYKNYLLFNENIVSKENVRLYRDGNVVYTINDSIDNLLL